MAEIYQHRELEADPDRVSALLQAPGDWLDVLGEEAGRFGEAVDVRFRGELGLGSVTQRLSKKVRFEIGRPRRVRDRILVPMTWEATGFAGLFPVMDALVEIHPTRTGSRLLFWGRYDPPLGRAGDLADRLVAHEVADATVGKLLDALESRIHIDVASAR